MVRASTSTPNKGDPTITAEQLIEHIRSLRGITNPDKHVQMITRIVVNFGLGFPDVVVLAKNEIARVRCSDRVQRTALAELEGARTPSVFPSLVPNAEPILETQSCPTSDADSKPKKPRRRRLKATYFVAECDPELTRIANGLHQAAPCRLWLVAHAVNRIGNGVGQIGRKMLRRLLPSFGITMTRRYFNRLLKQGNGIFWAIAADGKMIHLRSTAETAKRLTRLALAEQPDLVETNRPGRKFKTLILAGSIATFEATCFAAWIDSRLDTGMTNIAIATLASLFGRCPNTIRDWLDRAGVKRSANYAQYAGDDDGLIPNHATLYITKAGETRVTWRIANSYTPTASKERQHRYTPRHVYHACQHVYEEESPSRPAGECGTALPSPDLSAEAKAENGTEQGGGVYRTGTLFFVGAAHAHERRKRVYSHLKWHQDEHVPHYILLGFKQGGRGIYECVDPSHTGLTTLKERHYRAEYDASFQQCVVGYRDYLTERG